MYVELTGKHKQLPEYIWSNRTLMQATVVIERTWIKNYRQQMTKLMASI